MTGYQKTTGILLSLLFVAATVTVFADEAALSGIDARKIAVTGVVDLFVTVVDEQGSPVEGLAADDFSVREAPEGEDFGEILPLVDFAPAGIRSDGLVFLVLIDDSGSMYDSPDGRVASSPETTRAAMARREASRFLDDLGPGSDRAGLAFFGTRYRSVASPRTERATIRERLGISAPPEAEEAYTELYAAVVEASRELGSERGRRIVILFSDGENYPFFERKQQPHPQYGERVFRPDDSLKALREEGVTLYAVRFGPEKDEALADIARATGGLVFDVSDEQSLAGLYSAIRERVRREYLLTYRPRPSGADETRVAVEVTGTDGTAALGYSSLILFGSPAGSSRILLAWIALPAAALIILILWSIDPARRRREASLERLRPIGGGTVAATIPTTGKTVISPGMGGGATSIDTTGKGPAGKGTIVVEKNRRGDWTIASTEGVVVNNRKVEKTVLSQGDVIKAGDELIVFDDAEG